MFSKNKAFLALICALFFFAGCATDVLVTQGAGGQTRSEELEKEVKEQEKQVNERLKQVQQDLETKQKELEDSDQ